MARGEAEDKGRKKRVFVTDGFEEGSRGTEERGSGDDSGPEELEGPAK